MLFLSITFNNVSKDEPVACIDFTVYTDSDTKTATRIGGCFIFSDTIGRWGEAPFRRDWAETLELLGIDE